MKAILANLGFIFQIAGLLVILPIGVAFYFNEMDALISFFITCLVYFVSGFLLNALCERKELDLKSSCILSTIIFFLLGSVGTIPYFYLNLFPEGDPISKFTNVFFEVVSGQTTTGYSFIPNIEALPKSVILYRGLGQWIGGMGILFIFLTFLYPEKSATQLGRMIGLTEDSLNLKRSFISILLIQTFYVVVFILLFFYIGGLKDIINLVAMVLSSIAAGGIEPVTNFSKMMMYPNNIIMSVIMILAATSFPIHYKIFTGKFKTAFTKEFFIFLSIILIASLLLFFFSHWEITTAFFHIISASAGAGYNLLDFSGLSETIKLLFILLMFIGGCSLSPAGGIKVIRAMMFFKSIPWIAKRAITNSKENFHFNNKEISTTDFLIHISFILLAVFIVFVSAIIFMLHGSSFINSLFGSVSAFTNVGIPIGIVTVSLPLYLKWLVIFLMIWGRIEIIPFLIALSPYKPTKPEGEVIAKV
jgi:trk system potassium uptake protein TrkH